MMCPSPLLYLSLLWHQYNLSSATLTEMMTPLNINWTGSSVDSNVGSVTRTSWWNSKYCQSRQTYLMGTINYLLCKCTQWPHLTIRACTYSSQFLNINCDLNLSYHSFIYINKKWSMHASILGTKGNDDTLRFKVEARIKMNKYIKSQNESN